MAISTVSNGQTYDATAHNQIINMLNAYFAAAENATIAQKSSSQASASPLTITTVTPIVTISGTTPDITSITAVTAGTVIQFRFSGGGVTLTNGSNLALKSNFTTRAGDWIILECDGTNWNEVARSGEREYRLLGNLASANMNVTTDQAITIQSKKYMIRRITVTNASISLTTAVGGFYTAASKGGTTLVANTQAYSALTAATKILDVTLAAAATSDTRTEQTLYLSLTTAQGAAATADVFIYGEDII